MMHLKSRLKASQILFFSCDMQTFFSGPKIIFGMEGVQESCMFMTELASIFNIPVIVTEHNPKVFGHTIPEIKSLLPKNNTILFEKTSFTMYNEDCKKLLQNHKDRKTVVIYGIETHICVHQTCLDLLDAGFDVHVITDGTSTSKPLYRQTALQKLAQYGVALNTTQGVMFELLGDYKALEFKDAIKLVKKYPGQKLMSHL